MEKTEKIMEIVKLYDRLKKSLMKMPKKNKFTDILSNAAKSIEGERGEMLRKIRDFRNQACHNQERPEVPANYQEWINFLNEEIAIFEGEAK